MDKDYKLFNIRAFKNEDYDVISTWWKDHKEIGPIPGMMVEDGTFVLELGNIPALSVTVFLTQSKEIAYLEGLIKNPKFDANLEEFEQLLLKHCESFTKEKGYKRLICYCLAPKLKSKYERLGLHKTSDGLSSFIKEIF